jgi:hypothetical protein
MTLISRVANWFAKGPPAFAVRPVYQQIELRLWAARGQRGVVPHAVKQRIVKEYAARYSLETLVETGTYLGDMVWGMRRAFRDIYTVELEPSLYRRAVQRFGGESHVHLYLGDSAELISEIIARLTGPALFWLDGHFSGGITTSGQLETPIKAELSSIFADQRSHVVLIDDASDFTGHGDYPSVDELRSLLQALEPNLCVTIADNIIRVHGPQASR